MNDRKYHFILVLISVVIAATLAIQLYWNYNNFQESKRVLVSDLQMSLDKSVDVYYEQLIKRNNLGIIVDETTNRKAEFDKIFRRMDSVNRASGYRGFNLDNVATSDLSEIRIYKGISMDSLNRIRPMEDLWNFPNYEIQKPDGSFKELQVETFFSDQHNLEETISSLTSKIVVSIQEDQMNLKRMDSLISANLQLRGLDITHDVAIVKATDNNLLQKNTLKANSELLKSGDSLLMSYSGLSPEIYRLNLTGIILSALLITAVVLCLFYLLQIIRKQKALGEMKNDLISNITHEFKTPIATASAALEGVQSFTNSGDQDKTDRYLSMGREQLVKLNGMVERILETATLDSDELMLQKSGVEINELIEVIIHKHQNQTSKKISFIEESKGVVFNADAFHLENAINNLIDNAIKYGGDQIEVSLRKHTESISITVTDDGKNLSSKDVRLIFDKFYRVGKGNRHDVKGFGIGLFYTKSIIEKHKGTVTATVQPQTSFKITLPYE
ncbi:two-component sensor histidine kinase [Nonlabens sp. MB-3u-79]|uniref:sensor histidine kinase n=1 Tax=Nonlabens sp. MB-3u-79 TaxID=2058134 RepID=UPI000C309EA0|nr:HAMP domain-containing sensor histidine kinase [Nonlabens sp. MB-3u-79]AUC78620.1 two-component sensor histidine kinase [Nonlabens sp. MB-3u-79]